MAHPDNTINALKDQPLFVERWQCKFGWHRWTKWSDPQRSAGGAYVQQHKRCTDCGIAKMREV